MTSFRKKLQFKFYGKIVLITILALLTGCTAAARKQKCPPDKSYEPERHMNEILQQSAVDDRLLARQENQAISDQMRSSILPKVLDSSGKKVDASKRFDVSADQVPARVFFLSLVQDTPYNVAVHPGVEGSISLQLKRVTIEEVLDTVRNIYGFDYRTTATGFEILPASLQTKTFTMNYLDINRGGDSDIQVTSGSSGSSGSSTSGTSSTSSSTSSTSSTGSSDSSGSSGAIITSQISTTSKTDFWTELKAAVETLVGTGEGRRVATSPMAGLIVVTAMPEELRRVEEFLTDAERSLNRQVILEAKVLEVELNNTHQAGINWSVLSGKILATQRGSNTLNGTSGVRTTIPSTVGASTSAVNITPPGGGEPRGPSTIASDNVTLFGGVFALAMNFKHLGSFVELLSGQGKVQVLSSPRVSTTNNQKALIKVGTDDFFVTNISASNSVATTGTITSAPALPNVTFSSFFSGIALDVTPHISKNGDITLHIHPTISEVTTKTQTITIGTSNGNQTTDYPLASSNVRESDSVIRAKSGQVVVIGGLMRDKQTEMRAGIPVLKDLPVFGGLFRQTAKGMVKSELVILLRPIVVNASSSKWSEVIDDSTDRFNKLELQEDF